MEQLQEIQNKIYEIRGQKVMLDRDLAEMYGVQTKALNQAVKRNIERFPEDFMFQLTNEETQIWRSQFVTSNSIKMGVRRNPYAIRTYQSDISRTASPPKIGRKATQKNWIYTA